MDFWVSFIYLYLFQIINIFILYLELYYPCLQTIFIHTDGGPMFVREREHEVAHRQMLCRVLESLRYNGWEVMIAARLSRRV